MSDLLEKNINHYKRDIEKITSKPDRAVRHEERLLHCLAKLDKLPVKIEHLQTTGVGKTVNSLRKINLKSGVLDAAKALVAKWKNMVIEEDDTKEATTTTDYHDAKKIKLDSREYSPHEESVSHASDYTPSYTNHEQRNSYSPQGGSQNDDSECKEYSPSKNSNVSNGYSPGDPHVSSPVQVMCYLPSKKSDDKEKERRKERDREKRGESSKTNGEIKSDKSSKSSKSSSSHEKSSRSESSSSKSKTSSSSHSSSSSRSKDRRKDSSSKSRSSDSSSKNKDEADTSLSGGSFADALGPMVVKKSTSSSSSKKKVERDKSPIEKSSSSSKKVENSTSTSTSAVSKYKSTSAAVLLDSVSGPSHLSPLDMDVVSTLSTPTPNYRPMPAPSLTSSERRQRAQDEEDALERMMSNRNKNSRTKVYSGVKGGYNHLPTLYEICANVLKQHIDALEFTGGVPYSVLKPVLDAATPTQLYQFENYNPYMIGDTDDLWKFHVNREFRNEQREEMETWRDMYLRCVDEREEKYKAVTANIQKSIKKSVPVRQTKLAYVDVAKPPRSVIRQQQRNGTSKPDASRLMGKDTAEAVVRAPPPKSIDRPRVNPQYKPKVAPLMQKTLKSIKMSRQRR